MAFEVQTDTLFERMFRHFKQTIVKHGLLAIVNSRKYIEHTQNNVSAFACDKQ